MFHLRIPIFFHHKHIWDLSWVVQIIAFGATTAAVEIASKAPSWLNEKEVFCLTVIMQASCQHQSCIGPTVKLGHTKGFITKCYNETRYTT